MMDLPPPMRTPDVLIVEDDPELRDTLAWLFDEETIPFRLTATSEAALDAARATRPAVVLLDLTLPGMPPTEFVRLMRASALTAEVPIIVVSAVRDVAARARDIGADEALAKPYDVDALLAMVRAHAGEVGWARR